MTEELEAGEVVWLKSGALSRQADYKEGSIGTPKMTIEVISLGPGTARSGRRTVNPDIGGFKSRRSRI